MSRLTLKYKNRNDPVREMLKVAPIGERMIKYYLRWFGHVSKRLEIALVQ